MTIKLRLLGIISVLGLAATALSGNDLLDAYRASQQAGQARHLAGVDAALTRGLTGLRFERGGSTSALTLEPAKLGVALKEIADRRRTLDGGLTAALATLAGDEASRAGIDTRVLVEQYRRWQALRSDVDAALAKPVAERDPTLSRRVVEQAANLLNAVNAVVAATDLQVRRADPRLSDLLRVRELAWAARNAAGDASAIANGVLGGDRLITLKEQLDYAALSREATFAYDTVRGIVGDMSGAEPLKTAVQEAQGKFFEGALAERNRTTMPALADRSLPRPSVVASREAFNPALDLVAGVVMQAVDLLEDRAEDAASQARRDLLAQGLLLAFAALLAAGGATWVIRGVASPLAVMTDAMRRLAEGDAGFAIPFAARRDEVGAMSGAVQVFKDNLIRTRRLEEETALARASAEEQRRAGMHQMADAFEAAVGGIVGMVCSSATELQATAQTMTATATQTAAQSTSVAAAAEEAGTNVGTVAAAAEELGASVHEIARQVAGSSDLAQGAVAQADQTAGLVQELSEAVSKIGDVVGLISSIAGQTNLLALNATIEAARAGEAGRGFAVVAAEVKELASQTAKATEEITGHIQRIQGSTGQAVTAMGAIATRIREINGGAASIAAAVEEQGAATQEIARNVAEAAAGMGEVTGNIAGVAGAAEETGAAASQVLASASELSRQSEHLTDEVQRFLDTVRAA